MFFHIFFQYFQANVEKYIGLLTAAMTQNLHKTLGVGEKIPSREMIDMVGDLKQLYAALDLRLV